jgi:hypothetical protein
MNAQKGDGGREADHVLLLVVVKLVAVLGVDQACGDDRCGAVQVRVIAHVLEGSQNFNILKKALGDLLAFRVAVEVLEAENLPLAG